MTTVARTHGADLVPQRDRFLINEDVAAALLSVSRPTFRVWVRRGLISPIPLPGNLRRNLYRRVDVEALADSLANPR